MVPKPVLQSPRFDASTYFQNICKIDLSIANLLLTSPLYFASATKIQKCTHSRHSCTFLTYNKRWIINRTRLSYNCIL